MTGVVVFHPVSIRVKTYAAPPSSLSAVSPGAVLGHSAFLEAGEHSNVEISLDSPISAGQTLIAMAHTDDGDQSYEFPDADGPYTTDGRSVTDPATITLIC